MSNGTGSLVAEPPRQQQQHPDHQNWHRPQGAGTEKPRKPDSHRRCGWMFYMGSDPDLAAEQAAQMGET